MQCDPCYDESQNNSTTKRGKKKKKNSLGYNNPVQYWTWKLLTGWWDSGDCQSWEKWAQLDCTLKDSCQPSQYEFPILQRVRHHNMEVLPDVKCSWRRTGWKFQGFENYAKLTTQKLFEGYFLWIWSRFRKKCS
jgi:hypothetical protein